MLNLKALLCWGLAMSSLLVAPIARSDKGGALDRSLSRQETAQRLNRIIGEVRTLAQRGARPVVVFDIDDTLVRDSRSCGKKPMHGAVTYLKDLQAAGARVVYLSARPAYKRADTEQQLGSMGFPVAHATILLNDLKTDGVSWKRAASPRVRSLGFPVALFDNDKAHVRTFRGEFPTSHVFRLNTRSSHSDPGGTGLFEVIDGYYR
jgi:hypothetical protein